MKHESRNKLIIVVLAVVAIAFFAWWGSFDSIGDVVSNPDAYRATTVHVFGRTGPAYNVPFVGGLYKFRDTSGSIWVISKNDSTTEGRFLYLEGSVLINADKQTLKLKSKLQKILDREIFEGSQLPHILMEQDRGGIFASLKVLRKKK